jgi:hypothetical protein
MRRSWQCPASFPPVVARRISLVVSLACLCVSVLAFTGVASADPFFPHPANATWTYGWSDTQYNPSGAIETASVASESEANGCGWNLTWTGTIDVPLSASGAGTGTGATDVSQADNGTMCFLDQSYGLENSDWSASTPPIDEPSLCVSASSCSDSLGSFLFNVIWGSRNPLVSEPLLTGTSWTATGGGSGNVTSTNQYLGLQLVKVPAFPTGIVAAAVRSQIALAGTPGDDYGSGIRTTWWAYGIGPVKFVFNHVNGAVTTGTLDATNLTPVTSPPDSNYFPMGVGASSTYRWTNNKHMTKPEVETVKVAAAANRSDRLTVKSVSGPIKAAAGYVFSLRLNGLENTYAKSSAATQIKFPKIGHGRHFFTPIDFMVYGFGPVLPAYGVPGTTFESGNAYDLAEYGVTGKTTVVGLKNVTVPAGTFKALEVRSTLTQKGYAYGSGVRTMWFAPGRGLVKLTFAHRDGSTDLVQLTK